MKERFLLSLSSFFLFSLFIFSCSSPGFTTHIAAFPGGSSRKEEKKEENDDTLTCAPPPGWMILVANGNSPGQSTALQPDHRHLISPSISTGLVGQLLDAGLWTMIVDTGRAVQPGFRAAFASRRAPEILPCMLSPAGTNCHMLVYLVLSVRARLSSSI